MKKQWPRIAGLALGLLLVLLVSLPPFVAGELSDLLMAAFSGVCHQLPARSPRVDGVSFAVCFRCYGIYWGLPIASVLYPILHRRLKALDRRAPLVLIGSLVPAAVDWTLEVSGVTPGSQAVRVITGLVFGIAAGYYLVLAFSRTLGAVGGTARQGASEGPGKEVA